MTLTQHDADIIIAALRTGTVPSRGLHQYAVGLDKEFGVLRSELQAVKNGQSRVKGVRGAYGSGKTFVVSHLAEDALNLNFVVSKVTLNRDGSSLAALERLYQGVMQNLRMRGTEGGALPALLDRWVERAESYAVEVQGVSEDDRSALRAAVGARLNEMLGEMAREKPAFAAALAAYAQAHINEDYDLKRLVVGWSMADPNISARAIPGVRGQVGRTEVLVYLRVLVGIVRSVGRAGVVVILDELDEMRKLPSDQRAKAWANLRDLLDQVGAAYRACIWCWRARRTSFRDRAASVISRRSRSASRTPASTRPIRISGPTTAPAAFRSGATRTGHAPPAGNLGDGHGHPVSARSRIRAVPDPGLGAEGRRRRPADRHPGIRRRAGPHEGPRGVRSLRGLPVCGQGFGAAARGTGRSHGLRSRDVLMTALALLSPALRHGVIDILRWQGLRPVQEAAIPPVLAGEHVVVLAPTAGGKTEAVFLPALDVLLRDGHQGVGLLYVSPLVALLNNQEQRAERLAALVGMRAFKWHGGVGQAARRRFLEDPAEVLLTTPESLEAMLIGRSVPVRDLFATLRFLVIDEVHAFAGSDRGAHLSAVLERIAAFSEHDVQRVGLSATVLNPGDIGRWLKGRSTRAGRVVRPGGGIPAREAHILAFTEQELARGVPQAQLHAQVAHGKSLIFTESRADAEAIAAALHQAGHLDFTGTYHSAISLEARKQAEDALNGSAHRTVCLACTSAMELGIDVGDLDRVVQWGPPHGVSSLLQRWGRTGRREGRVQSTTIYVRNSGELLTALAQVSLAQEGWSEPVRPRTRAYHILFQQMLNAVLHSGGINRDALWQGLLGIAAFRDISREEYDELVQHLLATGMLAAVSGVLVLGDRAERQLGARRFQALITSFDTPDVYVVKDVANFFEVGQLESWFVDELRQSLEEGAGNPVIVLSGRAWQVLRIHEAAATLDVCADKSGQLPKWLATTPHLMDERLAWQHREVLVGDDALPWLNATGQARLAALRSEHRFLRGRQLAWRQVGQTLQLHTYAGTRINKTLELLLKTVTRTAESGPFVVQCELERNQSAEEPLALLEAAARGLAAERQQSLSRSLRPMRLSKYQPYLPDWMAQAIVADHLLDFGGLQAYLSPRVRELTETAR